MMYKASEIAVMLGVSGHIADGDAAIDSLLTDSRSLRAGGGSLFFAIPTSSGDGHNFIKPLYDRGVRNFVVTHIPGQASGLEDCNFFVTESPVAALQRLAGEHRSGFDVRMVAVTGSRGKTIVKEWICQALEPAQGVVRSPRSYNSQIGVPLSLWQIDADTHTAVIEAGISCEGEMEHLAGIIRPDIAVFTNLGAEHASGFSSERVKALEKSLLASGASVVVYPADDALLAAPLSMYSEGKLMLGWSRVDSGAPVYVSSVEQRPGGGAMVRYRFRGCDESAEIPFGAAEDVENAITTLVTLLALGMEPARISYALGRLRRVGTRMAVSDGVNDCLVAFDSYTCDLASLESALDFVYRRQKAAHDHRTSTLILSDLHHDPGVSAADVCSGIASLLRRAGVSRFIGVGPELGRNAALFPEDARFFADTDEMMQSLSTSDFSYEYILLKGAPEYEFTRMLHNLEARTHETVLEVNLDSIVRNFNYFRSHLPSSTGIVAMVKASGYGAGSLEIAKTLQSQGASYLAVAVLDEGIELRRAGITMPIMVMNPKVVNYRAVFQHRLEPEIYCMDMLYDVIREAGKCGLKEYPIHIKLDTGMHRMGFCETELDEVVRVLNATDTVRAATLFSHLATADCPDMDDYTLLQLDRFEQYTQRVMVGLPYDVKRHVLNSAGILRFAGQYHYDFARLGIGLYGVNTLPAEMEKPLAVVSALRTVVIAVREWKEGETVGYGRRGVLHRDSRVATIPIGYADGMNRHFGNGASRVLVNGHECPTVGNICMDSCMVDVTGVPCEEGDVVEIFGPGMPVQRLADILGTIPYEILTSVSPRVKRVYYRE